MLWSRYRGHASSESDFNRRRHSSVDCTQLERRNEHVPAINQPNSQPITRSFAEESDLKPRSLEQPNVDENFSNSTRPPSPAAPEPLLRPQRFSLFRSRHASDSQLSKTAKSQSSTASPPMPLGKLVPRLKRKAMPLTLTSPQRLLSLPLHLRWNN